MARFVLALSLFACCPVAFGAAAQAERSEAVRAHAAVQLRIAIPRVLRLRLWGHPSTVRVSPEDVTRGEIVVHGAHVEIVANDRRGYLLRTQLRDRAFAGVTLTGLGPPIDAAATQGATTAMHPPSGSRAGGPRGVEYRLRLAPDARPGDYAWPVALTLQAP